MRCNMKQFYFKFAVLTAALFNYFSFENAFNHLLIVTFHASMASAGCTKVGLLTELSIKKTRCVLRNARNVEKI